jgi:hypothetical protein
VAKWACTSFAEAPASIRRLAHVASDPAAALPRVMGLERQFETGTYRPGPGQTPSECGLTAAELVIAEWGRTSETYREVRRPTHKPEVAGSNPTPITTVMSRDTVHRCLGTSFTAGLGVGSSGWGRVVVRAAVFRRCSGRGRGGRGPGPGRGCRRGGGPDRCGAAGCCVAG